jgi:hypothetical protein
MVCQAARLILSIFHSKNFNKGEKSCSYLVRYVTLNHNEEFGVIEYFVRVKNSNQVLALIQHIDAETNYFCDQLSPPDGIILDDKYKQALNIGKLSYFYRVECIVDSKEYIKVENILNKCISVSFGKEEEMKILFT